MKTGVAFNAGVWRTLHVVGVALVVPPSVARFNGRGLNGDGMMQKRCCPPLSHTRQRLVGYLG